MADEQKDLPQENDTASTGAADETPVPDPEVVAKPGKRKYTAEYKAHILAEADQCKYGELGALCRREGLYLSTISKWHSSLSRRRFASTRFGTASSPSMPTAALR